MEVPVIGCDRWCTKIGTRLRTQDMLVMPLGGALKWAGPALQANREIVLAAVKQNGRALEFARLSKDADLLLEVCRAPHP